MAHFESKMKKLWGGDQHPAQIPPQTWSDTCQPKFNSTEYKVIKLAWSTVESAREAVCFWVSKGGRISHLCSILLTVEYFSCQTVITKKIAVDTHTRACMHTHTHTPFYGRLGFCLGLTGWAGTRKVNQSGFTGARDSECQWHQLGNMQICTLTKTQNCSSIPQLNFLQVGCHCHLTNSVKALKIAIESSDKILTSAAKHGTWWLKSLQRHGVVLCFCVFRTRWSWKWTKADRLYGDNVRFGITVCRAQRTVRSYTLLHLCLSSSKHCIMC